VSVQNADVVVKLSLKRPINWVLSSHVHLRCR